jgi:FAD/FMN-containing dehydrogenase
MRVAPFHDPSGVSMCDKCVELDGKIEHYQRLSSRITDQRTLDGIKELIASMKAQKAALHPEQEE